MDSNAMVPTNDKNMVVRYESVFGTVELTPEVVKNYLVKGQKNKVKDEEIVLFIKLCQAQKVNPFVQGEVHLIKYDEGSAAQMVIGYDTYKRRAEENPSYVKKESGIIVQRGNSIVSKQGACTYPGEVLIGGWCRVFKNRCGQTVETYKEVALAEYDSGKSTWKAKPCMMIEKVAISQALREAFPTEFEGIYTEEELPPVIVDPVITEPVVDGNGEVVAEVDRPITQEERKELFTYAQELFGKEKCNDILKEQLAEMEIESTSSLTLQQLVRIKENLVKKQQETANQDTEEQNS